MQQSNSTINIIELKNISFSYGENQVLKDVSLEIYKGQYVGMVGPNGAGKTTLLKIMLGLLRPDQGIVLLFGQDISEFKDWQKIGYVPQRATSFDVNFPVTVAEVVMMGRYSRVGLFRHTNRKDRQIVEKVLRQVEMWDLRSRLVGDLSGGQQQRVFIARALATEPEIIFLDEPTTGVDHRAEEDFYSLLQKLNKEFHLTLILISHDIEMVAREANHIACINKELVCFEPPEQFIKERHDLSLFNHDAGTAVTHHHHH
ncbi:MAG: metal ABC transporter ATP-binding protein [Candidatus Vogelbacteria bacterium]|nr:metal ABC transporter ATP-binding protein [Candidatus Vogelbacteria bacterium]